MIMLACVDSKGGLGFEGKLPWYVPEELAHFRSVTMGRVLGVGGRTKLPPLPGREVITLSREVITLSRGKHTLNRFLAYEPDGIVIGGASIFEQCIGRVDTIILSVLHDSYTCDCWLNTDLIGKLYHIAGVEHFSSFDVFTLRLN